MNKTLKLIIDTDPGIDDAMAIFYAAAAPKIELLGLTTIFGNVTTEQATRNALCLLEWVGLETVPVAQGADKPRALPPFPPSHNVHGEEGLGALPAQKPKTKALSEPAAEFLTRMAREHKGELILCPIGPLTNIAAAIDLDPEFTRNLNRIVLMGGSLDEGGNITPHAEANIYHDPHAAERVFSSNAKISMVGLDVTHRILCTADDFDELEQKSKRHGGLINEMSRFYLHFYTTVGKHDGCSLHDPAAVIACLQPDLFTGQSVSITVPTEGKRAGATLRTNDDRPTIDVLTGVDAAAVKQEFMKTMAMLD